MVQDGKEAGENNANKRRVAPCVAHAYASEEQEEIYQKSKTQK